jgi:hypothetical protein
MSKNKRASVDSGRTVPVTLHCRDDETYSLTVDQFDAFDAPADVEQDIVVTAADLQEAVMACLRDRKSAAAKHLEFNAVSSLFSVDSASVPALVEVTQVVFQLATDLALRNQYLREDNRGQRTKARARKTKPDLRDLAQKDSKKKLKRGHT